eukprot:4520189-Amphidinium_carterae.1
MLKESFQSFVIIFVCLVLFVKRCNFAGSEYLFDAKAAPGRSTDVMNLVFVVTQAARAQEQIEALF